MVAAYLHQVTSNHSQSNPQGAVLRHKWVLPLRGDEACPCTVRIEDRAGQRACWVTGLLVQEVHTKLRPIARQLHSGSPHGLLPLTLRGCDPG